MLNDCMLTTIDNPYDPFEQFTSWFLFDTEKGYNSCAKLDRILTKNGIKSDYLSQEEYDEAVEQAIDEIIKYDFMNVYKKLTKQTATNNT